LSHTTPGGPEEKSAWEQRKQDISFPWVIVQHTMDPEGLGDTTHSEFDLTNLYAFFFFWAACALHFKIFGQVPVWSLSLCLGLPTLLTTLSNLLFDGTRHCYNWV